MRALETRWRLLAATLAIMAGWGVLAPGSLILVVGLLAAFGGVFGWVQYAIESAPERPPPRDGARGLAARS